MRYVILLLLALLPARVWAEGIDFSYDPTLIEVDVELALMVDVSRSMTTHELDIQRHGYAAALTSDAVMDVIAQGFLGRIAVTYVEWAGPGSHRIVLDWTTIGTLPEAEAVSAILMNTQPFGMQRTSISSALDYAAELIENNQYQGLRRVIDVSGDGPNNSGAPVVPSRDRVLAQGIVINGLPLMTDEGVGSQWTVNDLDAYYRDCVIGGHGAFVVAVHSWDEFASAVRQKILMEIASAVPRIQHAEMIVPVAGTAPGTYDCMAGEKTWDRFRQNWEP
ncbi:DUF1194 domain-containing protein [Pseudooceanicola sediminis]|uniref:DUF1194 domain-containing protein n=1 Tax=Pseudooceanicola sediminis TaxID=2211117 RepID=A0A399J622_9RHOB|nr:DUF1194 domain-containing protein [Pseudooceanicola sediminis]KAA2316137.1 DUF1194 domain-containing protein [Puniceibacterium sp. HSS470]RII38246.1 DUF1194 domain-containing protein [Pseudooceanicola sediminis]|tara:strand:- start:8333 stop:9166 length:834 start_codon:yes stop_codon:yes gene_type:complete